MATKPWQETRDKYISKEQQAASDERARRTVKTLKTIRKARELTQETMAETLGMTQGEVSKLEHRADVYVSTLRKYIEAMGGELKLMAHFPDSEPEEVCIAEFSSADDLEEASVVN